MKLVLVPLLLSSLTTFAANKVVQKTRVIDEKIVAAEGCSITGEYTNSGYTTTEYKYTVTMKTKILQKQEAYSVNVKKRLLGKATETPVPNSTKPAPDKTINSTRSISFVARFPTEFNRLSLLKACEDESLFINTGSYPPPPPPPPEPPKKEPVIIAPPANSVQNPGLPDDSTGLPGMPSAPVGQDPLFPIEAPTDVPEESPVPPIEIGPTI